MRLRIALGGAGVLLALVGLIGLVVDVPAGDLLALAIWLAAALVLHDGVLSPAVLGVGLLLERTLPPRARRYVQGALIAGAAITVVALPLILRAGSQPRVKALLGRDYARSLVVLLGLVAAVAAALYAVRVLRDVRADGNHGARDATRSTTTNDRPPADHDSIGE